MALAALRLRAVAAAATVFVSVQAARPSHSDDSTAPPIPHGAFRTTDAIGGYDDAAPFAHPGLPPRPQGLEHALAEAVDSNSDPAPAPAPAPAPTLDPSPDASAKGGGGAEGQEEVLSEEEKAKRRAENHKRRVEEECPFCNFMMAGPCNVQYEDWDDCVHPAKEAGRDFVKVARTFTLTLTLLIPKTDLYKKTRPCPPNMRL